jgi:hypothetical protein
MPGLDSLNKLADTLNELGADRSQISKLRTAMSDLRQLSRRLPGESAPAQATKAVDAIDAALDILLGGGTDDDEVRHFVETVARGGAHVRDLTPAVAEWMLHNRIEGSFRIVAGKPANE